MTESIKLTAAQQRVILLLADGAIIFQPYHSRVWIVANTDKQFRDQTIIDLHLLVTWYFDGLKRVLRLTKAGQDVAAKLKGESNGQR